MNIECKNADIINRARNSLTEFSSNYKLVNFPIYSCYRGLPNPVEGVAHDIFWAILRNRSNNKEGQAKKGINESKRIYNDAHTSIKLMLADRNCIKYADQNADINNDVSNYLKKIRELDENNVFYYWNYNGIFIFVMEREIGSWKYYNPSGCVIPKTIKKIVNLSGDMIKTMIGFAHKQQKFVDNVSVEKSFCKFLSRVVNKMNSSIVNKIHSWDGKQKSSEYISYIKETLKPMGDFEGLKTGNDFVSRLPNSVRIKFQHQIDLAEGEDMKKRQRSESQAKVEGPFEIHVSEKTLMNDLVPHNPIVAKRRRGRPPKTTEIKTINVAQDPAKPQALRFNEEIDPLKNAKEFVIYYRSCILSDTGGRAVFEPFEVDAPVAAKILDRLIMMGKADKIFIRAWIKYFFDQKLKGSKAMKPQHVGMSVFFDTLESYDKVYRLS